MPTCVIDGKTVEFTPGENLVEVAKRAGIRIPVFCYHPAMSVVAQCRMCTIEIKDMPKLQTACSTAAKDGMVVFTQSDRSVKQQEAVMEFLLVNHPLDCPICDKSGECDLQDFSYDHGSAYMRTTEDRRTYIDLDMGPVIEKNMNRCIHCTRCIRLGDEILGIREMVALDRGNRVEITTLDGRPLETNYAGNYADVCPTGSLTLKDFRFHKRAWMLKKTPTVCEGCSRGCNMEVHHEAGTIYRCLPRANLEINKHWLCDEGRFNFHYVHSPERIREPCRKTAEGFEAVTWTDIVSEIRASTRSGKQAVWVGSDLTLEEMDVAARFAREALGGASIYHFGTEGITTQKDDVDEDKILRRTSKTSNLAGAERSGLRHYSEMKDKPDTLWVFRGGRAQLPAKIPGSKLIGFGVFQESEAKAFDYVLAGRSFAEKSGTIINGTGIEQRLERAIEAPRSTRELMDLVALWKQATAAA